MPAADEQVVFIIGDVADVVQSVLDFPMATVDGEQFLRAGPLRSRGGKAEDGLGGGFPGADDLPLAHDAEGLASPRQGGQFTFKRTPQKENRGSVWLALASLTGPTMSRSLNSLI